MEFIEYLKFSTGQEKADIDSWKLENSYDLIQEFIDYDRKEQLRLHVVVKSSYCLDENIKGSNHKCLVQCESCNKKMKR
tara:strand:- start:284 stop:520 length:237 start_codon:yes stop_codon:yes gene_type:complete